MGWCTAQWKILLFCAKTIMKESHKFELARLKKKKKNKKKKKKRRTKRKEEEEEEEEERKTFWPSGDFLVRCFRGAFAVLFSATGCVVHCENTRR